MAKLPDSFTEALKSGYRVIGESSLETENGKRIGTLYLKNGSRPELLVAYEGDTRIGYRFSKPQRDSR
jgi:hypothetical protein